jgi:predicted amidophosphoribosyltransferase
MRDVHVWHSGECSCCPPSEMSTLVNLTCLPCRRQNSAQLVSFCQRAAFPSLQDRIRHQDSDKKARVREVSMSKLQNAAEVAEWIAGRVALAIQQGSGWQPSDRLVGVCCNTLDALLGASFRV